MEFKDYYQVLGVSKTSTSDEVKKAFRKLARTYHPDVNPGDHSAEGKFKELNEAYEVLSDANKRRKYDELGANWQQYEHMPSRTGVPFGGFGSGPGDHTTWRNDLGGGSAGRAMSEEEVREMLRESPFSDFFETFFGGAAHKTSHPRTSRKQRGQDIEHMIELSLEQAYRGVTQRLSIRSLSGGPARTVEVRIPAGVTEGSRVRVAGEGGFGTSGAKAGDLYLRTRITPHPVFECKGPNLYVKIEVPVTTAVLGGEVDVQTPGSTSLRLRIPSCTQSGQVFRLRSKGMPRLGRRSKRGDLYATVQLTLPDRLSARAREHYEALAALDSEPNRKGKAKAKVKQSAV